MTSFKPFLSLHSAAAVAAGLLIGIASPALAEGLWRFRSANGVWAYVDDEKKIPEAYKAAAEQMGDTNLASYPRYTPADAAAQQAYGEALAKRVELLRAINGEEAAGRRVRVISPTGTLTESGPMGAAGVETVVRTSNQFGTTVENQIGTGDGDEPVITEQVRLYVPGRNVTRTSTITRRGDRVISIQRPLASQNPLPDLYDVESDSSHVE